MSIGFSLMFNAQSADGAESMQLQEEALAARK